MELRTLRYFLAIAREGNMTAAAELLHISQSALSRQVAELEKELDTQLFLRSGRKLILTEDGSLLRQRAEEIVTLADSTEREFHATDAAVVGDIFIGAGETPAMGLLANCVGRVLERHPGVRIHLYSSTADSLVRRLNQGLLNFGLLFEPVDKQKFDYLPIPAGDEVGVLVRADGPFGGLDSVTPDDLKRMPLLVASRDEHSSLISHWLGEPQENLRIVGSYNLINNAVILAQAGIVNVVSIKDLIKAEPLGLKYIPLSPRLEMGLVFVWKKYQALSKAGQIFLEQVRAQLE